jgi:hypothetical protein
VLTEVLIEMSDGFRHSRRTNPEGSLDDAGFTPDAAGDGEDPGPTLA